MHRETPSQADPKWSCKVSENQAKQGLGGQQTEKAALFSPLTAHGLWPQTAFLGNRVVQHTNPASAFNPCSTDGRTR